MLRIPSAKIQTLYNQISLAYQCREQAYLHEIQRGRLTRAFH